MVEPLGLHLCTTPYSHSRLESSEAHSPWRFRVSHRQATYSIQVSIPKLSHVFAGDMSVSENTQFSKSRTPLENSPATGVYSILSSLK